jgi:CRP/FNR family transcriptional regulator, anaerobic regulatory protein
MNANITETLPPKVLEQVLGLGISKRYDKGYKFSPNLSPSTTLLYVQEGMLRIYNDREGVENNIAFFSERSFCTYNSFFGGRPDGSKMDALESVCVIEIHKKHLLSAYKSNPALEEFGKVLAEHHLSMHEKNYQIQSHKGAVERYRLFLNTYRHLDGRVSLKHIASFLKLDQSTLSRARAALRN